eukprot:CAMPEP_0182437242 /NCGR_PEP_ID=MMETSP1167-20130531/84912_1 /TAXON_ID=2988 /ORGANISM="Mallomonas Sp, Strain CCMP3275" /LENGTH=643 /DNA_ID=CAMNT_0024630087 /DNA_START=54 /DNA_END=1985 /DNA_ORIENTATION=-
MNCIIYLTFAAQFLQAFSAADRDEIISLPGWNNVLPSKHFSGYLDGSRTSHLHYWLVLAETSPETSPLVVWFNGGPGCSSMDGFFYEHGPFEVDPSDYSVLKLRSSRWSSVANVLYIEAPVGVGFSYSDDHQYKLDDDRTALENRAALEDFFKKFPEFIGNDFYITGESYAGIYVPTLAQAILEGQDDGTYQGAKLTGIAVGNGCTGNDIGTCGFGVQGLYYEWKYLMGTALLSTEMKEDINKVCDWEAAAANKQDALSSQCMELISLASQRMGSVNIYDIYDSCIMDTGCDDEKERREGTSLHGRVPNRPALTDLLNQEQRDTLLFNGGHQSFTDVSKLQRMIVGGTDECLDSRAASGYLNNPEVMKAIHVKSTEMKEDINKVCDWEAAAANKQDALSSQCMELISVVSDKMGVFDIYNIYDECLYTSGCKTQEEGTALHARVPPRPPLTELLSNEAKDTLLFNGNNAFFQASKLRRILVGGPGECMDSAAADTYLNNPEVMKAIHVKDPGFCWSICKTVPGWEYKSTRSNLPVNTYPKLVSRIAVIIYNGDWDACVPVIDNETWTASMGYEATSNWHPWTYHSSAGQSNQVAGYAIEYDVSALGEGSFQFITIKGGRHEVPKSAPEQALEMLRRLIHKEKF